MRRARAVPTRADLSESTKACGRMQSGAQLASTSPGLAGLAMAPARSGEFEPLWPARPPHQLDGWGVRSQVNDRRKVVFYGNEEARSRRSGAIRPTRSTRTYLPAEGEDRPVKSQGQQLRARLLPRAMRACVLVSMEGMHFHAHITMAWSLSDLISPSQLSALRLTHSEPSCARRHGAFLQLFGVSGRAMQDASDAARLRCGCCMVATRVAGKASPRRARSATSCECTLIPELIDCVRRFVPLHHICIVNLLTEIRRLTQPQTNVDVALPCPTTP